uniref:Uncharacterized protein n=1 Tax=Oryza meridionalis TaxID=40149 RepID=A0A0E0FDH2_9ORYZ
MVHRGGRSTTVLSDSDLAPPSSIPVQPIQPLLCHRRRRSTPPPPALPDLTGARPPLADLLLEHEDAIAEEDRGGKQLDEEQEEGGVPKNVFARERRTRKANPKYLGSEWAGSNTSPATTGQDE